MIDISVLCIAGMCVCVGGGGGKHTREQLNILLYLSNESKHYSNMYSTCMTSNIKSKTISKNHKGAAARTKRKEQPQEIKLYLL